MPQIAPLPPRILSPTLKEEKDSRISLKSVPRLTVCPQIHPSATDSTIPNSASNQFPKFATSDQFLYAPQSASLDPGKSPPNMTLSSLTYSHYSFKLQSKRVSTRFLRCPPKMGTPTSFKSRQRVSDPSPGPPMS